MHGKAYYLSAIYPTLLEPGAVRIEEWLGNGVLRGASLAGVFVILVTARARSGARRMFWE